MSKLDAQLAKTSKDTADVSVKQDLEHDKAKHEKQQNSRTHQEVPKAVEPEQENVLDFVNEIKAQAMVNTFQQAGFIYEPTSGLYYDTKSKYYYSPEHDLYYNGSDGNWYRLNPRTHEFIFHSGTDASQAVKKVGFKYDPSVAKR